MSPNVLAWLGEKAAAVVTKNTVRSETVPVNTEGGKANASAALRAELRPAAHVPPTRYGRKIGKKPSVASDQD